MSEFLEGLLESTDMISRWATAEILFQLCHAPYLERLRQGASTADIASEFHLDPELFDVYVTALEREGVVTRENRIVKLSILGNRLCRYVGWFTLLVGGYGVLFRNVNKILDGTYDGPRRDANWVGIGSCSMSQYDCIPLTKQLMDQVKPDAKRVLDYGCGNAQYLVSFCERYPHLKAIGVEENKQACEAGRRLLMERGLEDRITLVNSDVLSYEPDEPPDFILFAFVLQEIVAQSGEAAVIELLRGLAEKFPSRHILVVEVDDVTKTNPEIFETPIGRGFYNYYFMLHPFTHQKLLPNQEWKALFARAGFSVIAQQAVDRAVDPSGLEIGYVLQPAQVSSVPEMIGAGRTMA
jgi:2-ketoarginine methyltransferase